MTNQPSAEAVSDKIWKPWFAIDHAIAPIDWLDGAVLFRCGVIPNRKQAWDWGEAGRRTIIAYETTQAFSDASNPANAPVAGEGL